MKKRLIFFPLFLAIFGFSAFLRTAGAENVRAVQMVTLIATGMCLGVALAHARFLLGEKPQP